MEISGKLFKEIIVKKKDDELVCSITDEDTICDNDYVVEYIPFEDN